MRANKIDRIVEALDDAYPSEDASSLELSEIYELIMDLGLFDDNPEVLDDDEILEQIQSTWINLKEK